MLDTHTLLVTQDRPSGPLLLIEDAPVVADTDEPQTVGTVIGQILGVALVIALGVYMTLAI
ncbi:MULTISPECIES: hypothetical protein [unclassified Sphingomonas]|jgi:hypothetical protein|uniref:hypothetical protein n=1 Tax=unclassified Sphingomonas TaxID=196159 RepID=UPI0007D94802|nr:MULTISPECIES: hypothetical protein [unclassified Sphingomonas]MCH4894355.1 hypothetical protein [Sphingomonas sp. SFZ2018-12]OAN64528.1 hypothetical protein A7X12_17650 [Sphingomonas sp. TDK1]